MILKTSFLEFIFIKVLWNKAGRTKSYCFAKSIGYLKEIVAIFFASSLSIEGDNITIAHYKFWILWEIRGILLFCITVD